MVGVRIGCAKKHDQLVAAWDDEAVDALGEGAAEPARRPTTKHSSMRDMIHLLPAHPIVYHNLCGNHWQIVKIRSSFWTHLARISLPPSSGHNKHFHALANGVSMNIQIFDNNVYTSRHIIF